MEHTSTRSPSPGQASIALGLIKPIQAQTAGFSLSQFLD